MHANTTVANHRLCAALWAGLLLLASCATPAIDMASDPKNRVRLGEFSVLLPQQYSWTKIRDGEELMRQPDGAMAQHVAFATEIAPPSHTLAVIFSVSPPIEELPVPEIDPNADLIESFQLQMRSFHRREQAFYDIPQKQKQTLSTGRYRLISFNHLYYEDQGAAGAIGRCGRYWITAEDRGSTALPGKTLLLSDIGLVCASDKTGAVVVLIYSQRHLPSQSASPTFESEAEDFFRSLSIAQ